MKETLAVFTMGVIVAVILGVCAQIGLNRTISSLCENVAAANQEAAGC